jgi:hypothetical protein
MKPNRAQRERQDGDGSVDYYLVIRGILDNAKFLKGLFRRDR